MKNVKYKLVMYYEKHVVKQGEFGNITQNQYLKSAKAFAGESGGSIREGQVGNIVIKYDPDTGRVLIGNAKSREIRTFYVDDGRDPNAFKAATEYAEALVGQ